MLTDLYKDWGDQRSGNEHEALAQNLKEQPHSQCELLCRARSNLLREIA
jgi:hypothetical protein